MSEQYAMYTLVHVSDNGTVLFNLDGSYDTVRPIDQESCGMLFDSHDDAMESARRHNDPDEYGVKCVVVDIRVAAGLPTQANLIGKRAVDKQTGLTGTITGHVVYSCGPPQARVMADTAETGRYPEEIWFDLPRLEILE